MRHRNYGALWIGSLSASFAMNMQQVARGWFIYDWTSSAVDLAVVTMSFMLPQVLLALPGGVFADRYQKRKIIVGSQLLNCFATLVMALVILLERVEFYHFILFGILNGSILAVSFPARHAMIPDVVPSGLVFSAIALSTTSMNFARVIAPAFAGFLIAWISSGDTKSSYGVGIVYLVITALYFLAAAATQIVSVRGGAHRHYEPKHVMAEIHEGLQFVWRHPTVFGLIAISIIPFLFAFPLNTFLPAFNEDILHGGPDDLGILLSALGIGSIIGSIMLATAGSMRRKGFWLFWICIGWGVVTTIFGFVTHFFAAILVIGIVGWCSSWNMAMNRALIQQNTRPQILSRVMSIDMMSHGLMPFGVLPIGLVADYFGVANAIMVSGLLFIVSIVILYLSTPTIRHLMKASA